jgi:Flp pilus assembly pilin Flp
MPRTGHELSGTNGRCKEPTRAKKAHQSTKELSMATTLRSIVKRFARLAGEAGASLVEYTLLVALIAAVAIGAVTFLGTSARDTLCGAGQEIAGATPDPDAPAADC